MIGGAMLGRVWQGAKIAVVAVAYAWRVAWYAAAWLVGCAVDSARRGWRDSTTPPPGAESEGDDGGEPQL